MQAQTYRIEFSHLSGDGRRILDADLLSAATAQEAVDEIRSHYNGFLGFQVELVLESDGSWYIQNTNWR